MDPARKLFKVRRTVFKMLYDRGYVVPDEDLGMQEEEFKEKYGDFLDIHNDAGVAGAGKNRDELTILTKMVPAEGEPDAATEDNEVKIFVFFPAEQKIGLQVINTYVARLMQENVSRCGRGPTHGRRRRRGGGPGD